MSNFPTILHVCPSFVDMDHEAGGVSNIVRQLTSRLAKRGWTVYVLCGTRELWERKGAPGTYREGRITRYVLEHSGAPWWAPFGKIQSRLDQIKGEIDVAHVHTCFSAFTDYSMEHLCNIGCPFVFTPHGKFSDRMLDRHYLMKWLWWHTWTKRRVQRAGKLVLSSRNEAVNLDQLGLSAEDAVIPNGFDAESSEYKDGMAVDSSVEDPYVLFLGYLDPRKQPELLVRAYAQSSVSETHQLVIAGPDAYNHQPVVEQAIREEGVEEQVTLYGPAYGEEKWALLSGASCFCLPSKGEGQPVTAAEALGAGTPVLISKQSNFPEIRENGAGIECDAFERRQWVEALEVVCHKEKRRMKMGVAAEALAQGLTWSSVVDQWEEIYQTLITEKEPLDE